MAERAGRRVFASAKLSVGVAVAGALAGACGAPLRAAELAAAVTPGLAAGWPVVLRGAVCGVPIAADMDGDGKAEIIAPAMTRSWDRSLASEEATPASQVWALRTDGSALEGWPLTVRSAAEREAMLKDKEQAGLADNWYASPSAWDVNGDGASEVIINTAGRDPKADGGNIAVLYADGGRIPLGHGGDAWASVPVADVDGDRVPDVVMHDVLSSVTGKPIAGWPTERRLRMAYQPAVGDADGDGHAEVFVPFYERDWHLPGQPENRSIGGFDRFGNALPGWPRKLPSIALYVVMGDVAGDAKKEIITVDKSQNLRVWNLDGTPVPLAPEAKAPTAKLLSMERRALTPGDPADVVLATDMGGFAPPCLADLDGDSKAEILMLGDSSRSVYAFRGDGRPFVSRPRPEREPLPRLSVRDEAGTGFRTLDPAVPADREKLEAFDARQRRGRIATLPFLNARAHCGVAAVDLGGDGVMDIFAGTHWIRLARDGSTQMTDMVPAEHKSEKDTRPQWLREMEAKRAKEGLPAAERTPSFSNDAGCSVADVDGDGLAEVVFGLSDGRLFLYRTGMSLRPRDAQWPTWAGNFQHTGVWTATK